MCEVLSVSHQTEIRSSHLVNFAGDYTFTCRIVGDILSFVDILPNTMVLRWDNRAAQCEGLSDHWESRYVDIAQGRKTHYPGDVAVIPIQPTSCVDQSEVVFAQGTVRSASMRKCSIRCKE